MKLSDYDPSNFYNNRGYKAITSNPNTPMMAKPQFVSNYKPSFNNTQAPVRIIEDLLYWEL